MGDLGKLREASWKINKELAEAEEAEIMKRGCRVCGGEIETGIYRREITLSGQPFSEGSMSETFIVCGDCQSKFFALLKGE